MKRTIKSLVGILLITALLIGSLTGCNSSTKDTSKEVVKTEQTAAEGKRKITDSVGRVVEIPNEIKRVAPSGSLAQIVLYSISPDKIIGWSKTPSKITQKYMDEKYWRLPEFGQFYGKNVSLNKEAIIKEKPDVIIDIGEKKKTIKEDMDGIQKDLNIPVIFVEATLDNMDKAYETLGDILGEKEAAKALSEYCKTALEDVKAKAATIKDDKKVNLYYSLGNTGLNTNGKGSMHTDVIDIIGANNVAVLDKLGSTGNGVEITMEELLKWNPEVILFSPDAPYDKVATDKTWKDVKAIKDGKYYQVPNGPYNWMGMPPSVNRIIGLKWLGNLLYPDTYKYDMVKETKEFYKLFYHYDLSDGDAKELLSKSTFK